MASPLNASQSRLIRLTKTAPCPQVRHRAHLLLAVITQGSLAAAARTTGVSAKGIGRWRDRFLTEGASGLADRPRTGRPSRITLAADTLLDEARDQSPMEHGYPVATWGLVDLADLLRRRCDVRRGTEALARHLKCRGYVYRRPRHDLKHRQDAESVESAKHTLRTLEKRGLIALDTAASTWTNAPSTPIPRWRRCGHGADSPDASPPPGPTGGSRSSAPSTSDRAGCRR